MVCFVCLSRVMASRSLLCFSALVKHFFLPPLPAVILHNPISLSVFICSVSSFTIIQVICSFYHSLNKHECSFQATLCDRLGMKIRLGS